MVTLLRLNPDGGAGLSERRSRHTMVGSAAEWAVSVDTPVAEGTAVASVEAGVAGPASGGGRTGVSSSSSMCCPFVLHGIV